MRARSGRRLRPRGFRVPCVVEQHAVVAACRGVLGPGQRPFLRTRRHRQRERHGEHRDRGVQRPGSAHCCGRAARRCVAVDGRIGRDGQRSALRRRVQRRPQADRRIGPVGARHLRKPVGPARVAVVGVAAELAGRAPRTRATRVAVEPHAEAGPVGHRDGAVTVGQLAAFDHVVGELVVVRVGAKVRFGQDRAEVQHRRELHAELARGVHADRRAGRSRTPPRPCTHGADSAPEGGVEQDRCRRPGAGRWWRAARSRRPRCWSRAAAPISRTRRIPFRPQVGILAGSRFAGRWIAVREAQRVRRGRAALGS